MDPVGIIADDLTGALDTGVQLTKWALRPLVVLDDEVGIAEQALVVSTDSRHLAAGDAYQRVRWAAALLAGRRLYKKIDSTARGQIGAELDGLLDGAGVTRVLVAPAFPAARRTTIDGIHYVQDVPLAESEFGRDRQSPITESYLPALIGRQSRHPVGHLSLAKVERGPAAVAAALAAAPEPIVVSDAVTPAHLHTLATALGRLPADWVPCGSAGLAEEWPAALGYSRPAGPPALWSADSRPVLVVAGSRHDATVRQLDHAHRHADLAALSLSELGAGHLERLAVETTTHLRAGRCVAIGTVTLPYVSGQEAAVAAALAHLAALAIGGCRPAGVVATGGDVAREVCRALGAHAVAIMGEVQAGVPAGVLVGGPHDGLRVVTKAGGFGDPAAISLSMAFIQGRGVAS